ncbi:hypothetical protein C4J81_12300 [Deltaproteobacteria bacterium Smac51]|nr:hypothetical protein C4J81_12300 [Deltaproteobacteria bacterium Smac51]
MRESSYVEKVGGIVDANNQKIQVAGNRGTDDQYTATALARAINENEDSDYWAMTGGDHNEMVYVFSKEGGNNNNVKACDAAASNDSSRRAMEAFTFEHVESGQWSESGTTMSLGGEKWGTMTPMMTKSNNGTESWNVTLSGRDVGSERDLWIANVGDLTTPGLENASGSINGMDRESFVEIQNAANANWAGAEVRTQSSAQEALDALTEAITNKDKIRADLGAMQNRLENTMTNLEIQSENLQSAESGISDVDVAKEMTAFTKNNVLTQSATSMLAQANSMSQLALSLIR